MKKLLVILLLLSPLVSNAQVNISKYIPKVIDGPPRKIIDYKWPYFGYIPPYIGIVGGYQGFKSNSFTTGLAVNLRRSSNTEFGGMAGFQLLHKRNPRENIQSFELEAGIYTLLCLGLNVNYNVSGETSTLGFRPFIGLDIYNVQVTWGYNLYEKVNNKIDGLFHSNWEVKYVIPIVPFKNGVEYDYPKYESPAYESQYIRSDIELR